jgi:hypothetical protein
VPEPSFALPTLAPWHRWVLGTLFGLFVAELVLRNTGLPLYEWLPWRSFGAGFAPWQPVTRFVVQGPDVLGVAFALLLLYFFLPLMDELLSRRQLGAALGAAAVGGTALPMLLDGLGLLAPSMALGWAPLAYALPLLLGLVRPDAQILLVFLPVRASWILWGTLVFAVLQVLVGRSLDSLQTLGVWLGVYAWFHGLGPGRHARVLRARGRRVEAELRKFEVLEGGKGPRHNRPDDLVH